MFPLNYLHDPGLEFLEDCSHEDLALLVNVLTKSEGTKRWSEYLTNDERFKQHTEKLPKAWQLIAAELQRCGADSIMSVFRGGQGVTYREILLDICSKLGVRSAPRLKLTILEARLLSKVLADAWKTMTDDQKKEFVSNWEKSGATKGLNFDPVKMTPAALLAALQAGILSGGFAAYQIAVIVANGAAKVAVGRGLAFASNAALTKSLSILAGPIGWGISAAMTVPATLIIAYLRQKHLSGGK
jgi:uncharacterized protein YaaW (UPF0174 family)